MSSFQKKVFSRLLSERAPFLLSRQRSFSRVVIDAFMVYTTPIVIDFCHWICVLHLHNEGSGTYPKPQVLRYPKLGFWKFHGYSWVEHNLSKVFLIFLAIFDDVFQEQHMSKFLKKSSINTKYLVITFNEENPYSI